MSEYQLLGKGGLKLKGVADPSMKKYVLIGFACHSHDLHDSVIHTFIIYMLIPQPY